MVRAGWLARVRRGVYSLRPLEAPPGTEIAEEDPWLLAARTFAPCYVGGWTAAGHWGLTEQLFKSTLIVTRRRLRRVNVTLGSSRFHVVRESRARPEGLTPVWRGNAQALVSSVERTLLDGCAYPLWLGGGRQLVEAFRTASHDDLIRELPLAEAAAGVDSGAALGRLGLLLEHYWPAATNVIAFALKHRGTSVVPFAPGVARRGILNRRWGVWVNVSLPDLDA